MAGLGDTLQYNLNRVANLLVNNLPTVDAQGAANVWAGTTGLDLVGALNRKAGTTGLELDGVCNRLAGTSGLAADYASCFWSSAGTLLASASFYISADGATANRQLVKNQGSAGSLLDVSVGSTAGSGLLVVPDPGYVYLPGVAGNYFKDNYAASYSATGDIDLRVKLAADDWTPGVANLLIGNFYLRVYLLQTGALRLQWALASTSFVSKDSTVSVPFADGSIGWVRAVLDVDNGASGYDVIFYTSTDGSTWTQLGATVTTTGSGVRQANGSEPFYIGELSGANNAKGKFYRAQVFNGIDGTKVLDVDCTAASTQRNTFQALTGQTVTINESGADSNDPKFLEWTGTNYVYIPGVSGCYLSVPDESALDITGSIDLRAQMALDDWTATGTQGILSKFESLTQISYYMTITTGGYLNFLWTTDGTTGTQVAKASSAAVSFTAGQTGWVRVTRNSSTGDVTFYTSTDGSTWTQLGTVQTSTAGSMYSGTSIVEIGDNRKTSATMTGKVYKAQILNGIGGTTVLNVDTSVITSGAATSFTALTGQTVTINRATSGRKTTVVKRPVWLFGTDDYMSVNNRWVRDDNDKYIKLPGVAGNYLSVPDAANLDIVGDLDLRAKVALDDWTPSSVQLAVAKYNTQYSFYFGVNVDGTLTFRWSADGSNSTIVNSTSATGFADNSTNWIRVAFDVDNGSSGSTAKFYTSSDGVSWTQLGSDGVTAGVTSIFSSNSNVEIGSRIAGSSLNLAGKVYQAQIFNGIDGTKVLDIDTSLATPAVSTFTAVTGQTVTINGSSVDVVNGNSVYLPGVSGNYLSVPDSAALDVTGDLDVRVRVALDDWTPAAAQSIAAKYVPGGNQRSWYLLINTNGTLALNWTTDGTGTTLTGQDSSVATGIADGTAKWIRATLDVDNGAGGYDLKYWTSDNGTVWTQLGSTRTGASITSIFSGTAPQEIGSRSGGADPIQGRILRAQIFNGINGTKVLDVDPNVLTSVSQTTFTERSSNAATVTINKSGTGYVSTPVLTSGYIYPTGVSNLTASATDYLNFGATDSFTIFASLRQWATPALFGGWIARKGANNTDVGYRMTTYGSGVQPFGQISDGVASNSPDAIAAAGTAGTLFNITMVVNRTAQTITIYQNGTAGTPVSISSIGSLANTLHLTIGRAAAAYQDFELLTAAIFRRTLTTDEIATLNTYFQGIAA